MVSSKVIPTMPSEGFGSPLSLNSADMFMENREVPSPSQYTDPSCSPPSMHSPVHYTAEVEKLDNFLKEEPASPYASNNSCNMLSMPQTQVTTDLRNFQFQNYTSVEDPLFLPSNVPVPNFTMMHTKLEPRIQSESGMNLVEQEVREILNNPEYSKTLNETLQLTEPETVQSMFFQVAEHQNYPQAQMHQLSVNNEPQQHGQQLSLQQASSVFNSTLMTANSPYSDCSESIQSSPRSAGQNSPDSTISSIGTGSPMPSFEDLLMDSSTIKSEAIEFEFRKLTPFVLNILRTNIISETGISHCPQEWSIADVRQCVKKSAEMLGCKLPLALENKNLDGPALLKMNPEEWAKLIDTDETQTVCEFLQNLLSLRDDAGQNVQVKVEMNSQVDMKQEEHDISQAMVPLPVAEAAMFQYKQSQMPQDYHRKLQHSQQYMNVHQQVNVMSPDDTRYSQNTSQFNEMANFSCHFPPQQENRCNTTVANYTQQPVQQGTTVQQHIAQSSSSSSSNKANPAVESQMPTLQPLIPAASSSPPVPLHEGVNGYLDDSGADLSALLQQHPQQQPHQQRQQSPSQHPTTIEQEDIMETDEEVEEEVVPASATGSSGRTHIQLWQFLKELLANNKRYGSCIRWLDRQEGIFKIEDSVKVATLWGERKNRPQMNYDKLSRSIRQYYNKNIMKKTERSQRLVYQFCSPYGN